MSYIMSSAQLLHWFRFFCLSFQSSCPGSVGSDRARYEIWRCCRTDQRVSFFSTSRAFVYCVSVKIVYIFFLVQLIRFWFVLLLAFLLSTVGMTEIEFNHTKNDHSRFLQFDFNKSMTLKESMTSMSLWLPWVFDFHESMNDSHESMMSLWLLWVYDSYESMISMESQDYESTWLLWVSMNHISLWLVCVYEEKKCGVRNGKWVGLGRNYFWTSLLIMWNPLKSSKFLSVVFSLDCLQWPLTTNK